MEIIKVTTHTLDALDRLPEQYRDKPKIRALISVIGSRSQELEEVFFAIIGSGGISGGTGSQLDQIGDIVGQKRSGREDGPYRIRILAKIGQNVSKGTAEDLISVFKLLMQADRVYYNPLYPASAYLTAIGTNPVGTIEEVREAMQHSHAAGVSIAYFLVVDGVSFSFLDDPDPNGQGFGDVNDPSVGGNYATIL